MFEWLFLFDDFAVGLGIVLAFMGVAGLLAWLALRSPWSGGVRARFSATADLTMLLSLLFSLMIGFLGAEIEGRNDRATAAVNAEANALQSLASILVASPRAAEVLRKPALEYVQEVLRTEFSGQRRLMATSTGSARMSGLFGQAIAFSVSHGTADATPPLILELVVKASEARAQRLALMQSGVNELKWWLVCFLLLALQVSIVLVNVEQPQKMLTVLALVSLAGSVTVGAAALQEDPFTPPRMVSVGPLELVLKSLAPAPAAR